MEIVFESENSDLVIEFEPNFVCENFSDRTEVLWKFQNGTYSTILADVFCSTPKSEGESGCLLPTLRLCG